MKRCIAYTVSLLATFSPLANAFDLQDAWDAALAYDASHSAAAYQRLAAQEQIPQARAPLLPQVALNGSYQRNYPIKPDSDANNSYGYNVQATQTLFDAGKYADYQQGKLAAQLADAQFDLSEQQLLLNVSQAYFDVLTAYDLISASSAAKKLYERQLEQAKTMFDVGAATIVDTHEAQAGLDNAQVQVLNAEQKLHLAQQKLEYYTGLNPAEIERIDGARVSRIVANKPLSEWQQLAYRSNTNIGAKQLAVAQAQAAVQKARANRYPKLELQAAYQDQHQQVSSMGFNENVHNKGASVGVNLSMPLYAGGALNSQVRQAQLELLQREDELTASKRDTDLQVREQYLNVQSGLAQVQALEQLVYTNRKKLESSQLGQQVGVRSNLDVIQAQQTLADSEQQLAKARYDYLQAQLALSQAAGQLQSGDALQQINAAIRTQPLRKTP
ncbi:TolC family outer membrane protein [Vitreoscilla massiliensis]|uniref:TolC family outer membrane protein n=1 Tax=Vitreoscilla massiliensis TaxID=1689272 RepID=A0ABY4DYM6_9NEIS|nr:TolC family outer membrane protein [Vitreoscilla massiliensis]UOO88627.1 TolC family outer membrane protein [Vitreoscilla massiliensis]